jgi:tetratricopeptide (TPR) repeat protein
MRKSIPLAILSFLYLSCSNKTNSKGTETLSKAPYQKLTDSIEKMSKDAGLYYRRGSLLYSNEEMALAEKDLRTAWQLESKEEHALRLTTVLRQKNPDTAILFLQEALKKIPESISLQILLAKGYQSKNELDKALAICDAVIAKYPSQLDALILKSELLKQQNKNSEALSVLETAYSFAPGDVDLVHQLAFEYAEAKNSKVLNLADSLIKVDIEKRHAEPYYFKGLYYENTGKYNEAIQYFDEAIRHDYNFLDAYMDKGQTLYEQKKYAEALKTFELATTVFRTEALPYYWLGKTQEVMGNKAEAKLNYQRAYGLDKTLTEAKEAADKIK